MKNILNIAFSNIFGCLSSDSYSFNNKPLKTFIIHLWILAHVRMRRKRKLRSELIK